MQLTAPAGPWLNGPVSSKQQICTGGEYRLLVQMPVVLWTAFPATHARTYFTLLSTPSIKSMNATDAFIHVCGLWEPGLVSVADIRLLVKHVIMHRRRIQMLNTTTSARGAFTRYKPPQLSTQLAIKCSQIPIHFLLATEVKSLVLVQAMVTDCCPKGNIYICKQAVATTLVWSSTDIKKVFQKAYEYLLNSVHRQCAWGEGIK